MNRRLGFGDRTYSIVNAVLLIMFAFICLYPFYYLFINSLSSSRAIARGIYYLPMEFTLKTYISIIKSPGIGMGIFISVARTIIGTILSVGSSGFVAFLFTQKNMPIKKYLYRLVIITMYINAGFIPYYLTIRAVGLKNSFLVYVIPGAVSAYFIILVKTYIESIPHVMQESAEIDGAGILTIFSRIIFPLCLPIMACLAVFSSVGQWNSWVDTLYFVTDNKLYTLQYILYQMLMTNMSSMYNSTNAAAGAAMAEKITPVSLRMAMSFLTMLPIICVYPFMQKYFVKGIMLGAVKG